MANILGQDEIDALLDVCDETTDLENLQYLRAFFREAPVEGTVNDTYIRVSNNLAKDIIKQLGSAIITLERLTEDGSKAKNSYKECGTCTVCGTYNDPDRQVCNCANKQLI